LPFTDHVVLLINGDIDEELLPLPRLFRVQMPENNECMKDTLAF